MNIHALSGIRTRNPSNLAALDLLLRPHGRQDRPKGRNFFTVLRLKLNICEYKLILNYDNYDVDLLMMSRVNARNM